MKEILRKIKVFLFHMRAKKYLRETPRQRRFVNYAKARSILILFESEPMEKNPFIRKMIAQLQQDGKKVSAWGFIDKKEVITSLLPDFRVLHYKQADFFEKPHISFINELSELEYDLVIDLSINEILPLQYIAMYANAYCKIGLRKNDLPIYDFIIDIDQQPIETEDGQLVENLVEDTYLYHQIIFYLKSIQTND